MFAQRERCKTHISSFLSHCWFRGRNKNHNNVFWQVCTQTRKLCEMSFWEFSCKAALSRFFFFFLAILLLIKIQMAKWLWNLSYLWQSWQQWGDYCCEWEKCETPTLNYIFTFKTTTTNFYSNPKIENKIQQKEKIPEKMQYLTLPP